MFASYMPRKTALKSYTLRVRWNRLIPSQKERRWVGLCGLRTLVATLPEIVKMQLFNFGIERFPVIDSYLRTLFQNKRIERSKQETALFARILKCHKALFFHSSYLFAR